MSSMRWKERFLISLGGFVFIAGLALITIAIMISLDVLDVSSLMNDTDLPVSIILFIGFLDILSGFILSKIER